MSTSPQEFYLPFIKKEQVAKDAFAFYFDRTKVRFNFFPGQYIRMYLPGTDVGGRGDKRPFTIASSPLEKEQIMIVTRVIQSAFKKRLSQLSIGEKIKFYGPLGGFVLHEEEKSEQVFLAGGIGMTPFFSMISYADEKKLPLKITLFISFSRVEDVIFKEQLEAIVQKNQNVRVVYAITRPEESKLPWSGEAGRISEELIRKHIKNPLEALYYIVGPPQMVSAMEELVSTMGVPSQRILIENFTGY